MLVSYQGHNVFSIYGDKKLKLKTIVEFIQNEMDKRQLTEEPVLNSSITRRIYRILSMPVPSFADSDFSKKGLQSIEEERGKTFTVIKKQ